jgi:urea transporter
MAEALIYRMHRYSLLLNLPGLAITVALAGHLVIEVANALFALATLALFFLAFLGEERAYILTAVFGTAEILASIAYFYAFTTSLYSLIPMDGVAVLLIITGLGSRSRYTRAREKKHLSDFVPPAFG